MEQFSDQIKMISKRIEKIKGNISTEESTKTSLILPFFQALGYDIFDPSEFTPEFIADVGIKKGEKVDYAIMNEGQPVILIEAKSVSEKLSKHDSQLFRYFGTTAAKFAILTNGLIYRFYTDLEEQNKMDSAPFFEINLEDLKETHIIELAKFRKDSFDLEKIFTTASDLKYLNKVKSFLYEQWENPTEDFIKYIVGEVYDGMKTRNTLEKFDPIIKKSFSQFINEQVNEKLSKALKSTTTPADQVSQEAAATSLPEHEPIDLPTEPLIITTEDEIQGYTVIKVIASEIIDADRVFYRDNQSYFNVLLDDNIRKWIVRLDLDRAKKTIIFNDDDKSKVQIDRVTDVLQYKDRILAVIEKFNN
ncbi:type I restriction endonuclease [Jeotgalibacillus salarius]|uniref:Endonuclease n=1 Tax=Jeotgalibacillus salarius TaxID=546023 RepID=A0A4Y8LEN4_9BACL|nr:type I restriction endonuclease [Jeotgalibacillus salarius]TFE00659.1 endonuclease [Jeotgalibacillus salarius]